MMKFLLSLIVSSMLFMQPVGACAQFGGKAGIGGNAGVGGGPASGPTIRGFAQCNWSGSSATVSCALPGAAVAGDFAIIQGGNAYGVSAACSGVACANSWVNFQTNSGTCLDSSDFSETLTSGDVLTGTVTVTAGGSYYGTAMLTVFVGSHSVQNSYFNHGLNTTSWPVNGPSITNTGAVVVLHFLATRQGGTPTLSAASGTQQGTQGGSSGVYGVSYQQAVASSSTFTVNYSSTNVTDGGCGGASWNVDEVVIQ